VSSPDILRVLPSKQETRAFYDKISGVYDLLSEHSEGPVRRAGLEKLQISPAEHVLEIGYGTGHSLVELAQLVGESGRVFGIDLSEGMRTQAHARLEHQQLLNQVELSVGDAADLPYPDAGLDAVFMSFTLELFDTPEIPKVLAECYRVLRPGGRIGVVAITKQRHHDLAVEAYEWTHRHFPNLLDCRPIYAGCSLEQAGFKIQSTAIASMWVPVEIVIAQKP
jgi:ubiquinone/menaquinone biosynthesis C-methylase UbiE